MLRSYKSAYALQVSFLVPLIRRLFLAGLVLGILLACRTLDLVSGKPVPPASQLVSQAQPTASNTPTLTVTARATRAQPPTARPTKIIPTRVLPTEPPPQATNPPAAPTEIPTYTRVPAPTNKPLPTKTPTPAGPTPTVAPTRCPQTYCVSYRGCQTDGNTIIEGIVYNNGVPENGVAVRAAKAAGAYPLVDDFVSGNDPINPGGKDPNNPGHYILEIVAGAPREGNWWVFVVDVPNGTKVISEAKLIHTNDDNTNPGNCQHAYVDFVR